VATGNVQGDRGLTFRCGQFNRDFQSMLANGSTDISHLIDAKRSHGMRADHAPPAVGVSIVGIDDGNTIR
jgi:hypothetical protein